MPIELRGHDTRVVLPDHGGGIRRLVFGEDREIPFLMPALVGEHFFTGAWPLPQDAIDYEPMSAPSWFDQTSETTAVWHQPETPYTHVKSRVEYQLVGPGTVEARFETRSHAQSYPHGYVGLFWTTLVPAGGQRGFHVIVAHNAGEHRWHYFQGGGDSWSPRANTILGPSALPAAHSTEHPPCYFLAESKLRFSLPVQVGRWGELYYSLELDSADVAFTNVLLGTAVGGPSWDVYWRLRPGECRTVRCRLTAGRWPGWEAVAQRYRSWDGCIDPDFTLRSARRDARQDLAMPERAEVGRGSALALSEKLFRARGRELLKRLGLSDRCSVGCFGGTSQNAGLDDGLSQDHMWGPYLTFLLTEEDCRLHAERLRRALEDMPEEVDGVKWIGYEDPCPRKTGVWEITSFLHMLTGLDARPKTDREWLPHLSRESFLGRRWIEQLFEAGQGRVFHDPGKQFTEVWRHWTAYVPPDIHRALLARSLFRAWNAGPEYNLQRIHKRGDRAAFDLCLARFAEEVIELAFCWNESFVPPLKWRFAHFRRLPICPAAVRRGLDSLWLTGDADERIDICRRLVDSVKLLMNDLYHVTSGPGDPLCAFAHEIHASVEDDEVKRHTRLDW